MSFGWKYFFIPNIEFPNRISDIFDQEETAAVELRKVAYPSWAISVRSLGPAFYVSVFLSSCARACVRACVCVCAIPTRDQTALALDGQRSGQFVCLLVYTH